MSFVSLEGVEGGERGNTSMTLREPRHTQTYTVVFCYGRSLKVELGSVAIDHAGRGAYMWAGPIRIHLRLR